MQRASAAENSELMEKHLLPRVMYSRNFFFPLCKTLVIYLFYSIWASSWEKSVLEEMGFVPQESVVRAGGLRSPTRWSGAMEPHPGSSQGCSQALPCCPSALPAQLVFAQPAHGHSSVSPAPSS